MSSSRVALKKSRLQRKFVNAMRGMGDVPWPARRFKYPATACRVVLGATCQYPVDIEWERKGKVLGFFRKPLAKPLVCGTELELEPFKNRVFCPKCRWRAKKDRHFIQFTSPPKTFQESVRGVAQQASLTARRMFSRRRSG